MLAVNYHTTGQFRNAVEIYDRVLKLDRAHVSYYCRAIAVMQLEKVGAIYNSLVSRN
jgi:hypothetical protein